MPRLSGWAYSALCRKAAKKPSAIICAQRGGVAQLGERRVRNAEVVSSILILSTMNLTGSSTAVLKLGLIICYCVLQSISAIAYAAEPLGNIDALRQQARALENGDGVARNIPEAIRLYCVVAEAGDPEARFRLGWIYAVGKGVRRDDPAAAYFFTRAAESGHPQSKNMLSLVGRETSATSPCAQAKPSDDPEQSDGYDYTNEAQRRLADLVKRLAPEYGIAPRLALTLARTESNLNPRAISVKNAQGLMQLIPETAERFNVRKPFDPEQNVRGGLAYLRWLLAYFQGDVTLVAAAYNAGEGAVNKYLGVPPYPETRAYVASILSGYKQQAHPFDASVTDPSPELPRIIRRKTRKES